MENICVLMSTYNGAKYLRTQIDSILNQKNVNVQLIVRDDGSKDDTIDILKEYEAEGKLKFYTGKNLKSANSFMDLLVNSPKADYYAFADQDDYWIEDKLEKGIELIKNYDIPLIYYSNAELVDEKLNSINKVLYKNVPNIDLYTISCASNVIGCTMIFNSVLVEIIKKYELPRILKMHDSYLAKVCLAIGGKIIYDKRTTIKYRQHGNNVLGIKRDLKSKLRESFHCIFVKDSIPITKQAQEILRIYGNIMPEDNKKWMEKIAKYDTSLFSKISLACSMKTRYITKNMSIKIRLAILFGNR